MAQSTESHITIAAEPGEVLDVITDFEAYPEWAGGITAAEVVAEDEDGWADQVRFTIDTTVVKDTYVLGYAYEIEEGGTGEMTWHLVSSGAMRALNGIYVLEEDEEGTSVTYRLHMELMVPLPGILLRRGERVLVDTALKGLKRRVETGE